MLRSEFLWWFLHEEREIPYQNQLQTWVYSRRVTRAAVIFWATAPVKIVFSFLKRRIILNFDLQNHLPPVSLPSKIEIVATPSERHLPTALRNFTQENWFWLIWFSSGLSASDNLFSSSKIIICGKNFHRTSPPAISFQKHRQPPQCLFRAVNISLPCVFLLSEAGGLRFSIQISPHEENISECPHLLLRDYSLRQAPSSEKFQMSSLSWIWFSNAVRQDYRQMESNSSPSSQPESTPEMVVFRTEICVTPSAR